MQFTFCADRLCRSVAPWDAEPTNEKNDNYNSWRAAGSRLVVMVGRGRKLLQRTPYNLFLELSLHDWEPRTDTFYTSDIEMSLGNAHIRVPLFVAPRAVGHIGAKGIHTATDGCAFLDVEPSQIVFAPAALDMPPDVLDVKVLNKLVAALNHHYGDARRIPVRKRRRGSRLKFTPMSTLVMLFASRMVRLRFPYRERREV